MSNADYQKGYTAGRKKSAKDAAAIDREAFRRAAFLAALPSALEGEWKIGGESMTSATQRVNVAWCIANDAVKGIK